MRLAIVVVGPGMHPSERLVVVPGVDRPDLEVFIDHRSIEDGSIEIGSPVGARGDERLVELPQEACNGARRIWVPKEMLTPSHLRSTVDRRFGCTIPVREEHPGLHPSEVVVAIRNVDGIDEMATMSRRSVEEGTLDVGWPVGRDDERKAYLVQLGRETHQGAHAVWVPMSDVHEIAPRNVV
jgi:hypothetical protein